MARGVRPAIAPRARPDPGGFVLELRDERRVLPDLAGMDAAAQAADDGGLGQIRPVFRRGWRGHLPRDGPECRSAYPRRWSLRIGRKARRGRQPDPWLPLPSAAVDWRRKVTQHVTSHFANNAAYSGNAPIMLRTREAASPAVSGAAGAREALPKHYHTSPEQ